MTEIRSFLGLAGYYRRFIKDFSKIAVPLTGLTKKGVKYIWSDKCETSFQRLKELLSNAPILVIPVGNQDFVVYPMLVALVWVPFLCKKNVLLLMLQGN